MAAAGRGNISVVEELVSMGADLEVRAANGWTARDIAVYRNQNEAVSLIESLMKTAQSSQAQTPVEAGMEIHEVRLKACSAQTSTTRLQIWYICRCQVSSRLLSDFTNQR